ncbi:hypothetical protein B0I35DRAFT_420930 [Stachybotrys elegans]|uniref:Uncharacterized protein n=1 Tax=Stachybotrys elegans TaxID=80388 RepID=A0A8K0SZH1_9HYPO|nr:hypothetical protein B0I35DRAFT_420930 [Stachybotrys elegans]
MYVRMYLALRYYHDAPLVIIISFRPRHPIKPPRLRMYEHGILLSFALSLYPFHSVMWSCNARDAQAHNPSLFSLFPENEPLTHSSSSSSHTPLSHRLSQRSTNIHPPTEADITLPELCLPPPQSRHIIHGRHPDVCAPLPAPFLGVAGHVVSQAPIHPHPHHNTTTQHHNTTSLIMTSLPIISTLEQYNISPDLRIVNISPCHVCAIVWG